jgi:hypothetical protein
MPSAIVEATAGTDSAQEQSFAADVDEQHHASNTNSGRWPATPISPKVAASEDMYSYTANAAAVSSSPTMAASNASLSSSRKRTGSLSADNIVLLDRVGQDRDRASSELGLVSDARILATTPTQSMGAVAVSAGMNTGGMMLVLESSSEGTLTVLKSQNTSSATASVTAVGVIEGGNEVPVPSAVQKVSSTDGLSSSITAVPATVDAIADFSAAIPPASSGPTNTTGGGDVIVVQRSLSDIENRRLKDSLFFASDFYLPLAAPTAPTSTAQSQAQAPPLKDTDA